MAGALGRTADKCNYHFLLLDRHHRLLEATIAELSGATASQAKDLTNRITKLAEEYTELYKQAEESRTALVVHRQALGFRTGNHKIVESKWPLPRRWPWAEWMKKGERKGGGEGGVRDQIREQQRQWMDDMSKLHRTRK